MSEKSTGSMADFAREIGQTRGYVSQLKTAGRLIFIDDAQTVVDFDASKQRIGKTADPSKAHVKEHHAKQRNGGQNFAEPDKVTAIFKQGQAQKAHYQGLTARDEYLRNAGKLLEKQDVEYYCFNAAANMRLSLETIPAMVAAKLEEPVKSQVRAHLETLIDRMINDFEKQMSKAAKHYEKLTIEHGDTHDAIDE